jgi:hypothetical protein
MPGGRPHRARMSGNRQPRRTAARWGPSDSYSEGPHSHLPLRRHDTGASLVISSPGRAEPPVPTSRPLTFAGPHPPVTLAPPVHISYVPCAESDKTPPPKNAPSVGKVSAVHDHPTPMLMVRAHPRDEWPAEGRPDQARRSRREQLTRGRPDRGRLRQAGPSGLTQGLGGVSKVDAGVPQPHVGGVGAGGAGVTVAARRKKHTRAGRERPVHAPGRASQRPRHPPRPPHSVDDRAQPPGPVT